MSVQRERYTVGRPDQAGREVPGPSVEIRLAFPLSRRDAVGMAGLFVQPKTIEHLGKIRDNDPTNRDIDYTGDDVLQYFKRNSSLRPLVARDSTGRVLGTITVELLRQNAGRLQLWVVDTAAQSNGPGIGLDLLQKAQALVFGPEEYGGLGREYTKAGVLMGIGGEWMPRSGEILMKAGFTSEGEPQDRLAQSYDSRRKTFVPRTLLNFSKKINHYKVYNLREWHNIHNTLAELHGDRSLPPPPPRAA